MSSCFARAQIDLQILASALFANANPLMSCDLMCTRHVSGLILVSTWSVRKDNHTCSSFVWYKICAPIFRITARDLNSWESSLTETDGSRSKHSQTPVQSLADCDGWFIIWEQTEADGYVHTIPLNEEAKWCFGVIQVYLPPLQKRKTKRTNSNELTRHHSLGCAFWGWRFWFWMRRKGQVHSSNLLYSGVFIRLRHIK